MNASVHLLLTASESAVVADMKLIASFNRAFVCLLSHSCDCQAV